ncbi:uncharacterized protein BO87DRAFT_229301 [Aspergillus neoniger CBS 115656]|uniref:Uncharacterized protein n=1 Tax=Aspergillus neoniger (strain CBS 115656) TaxID=1448310 RepID=A0A318YYB4_ASPNB|nr:hypothetical protein BO87DRAFT_229301 [Aspergillus neoniger CBS 115656]PYH36710.1 hypothetical protein BO87DRAFT_229301 [Aspergillus neoniger CBS 115656]
MKTTMLSFDWEKVEREEKARRIAQRQAGSRESRALRRSLKIERLPRDGRRERPRQENVRQSILLRKTDKGNSLFSLFSLSDSLVVRTAKIPAAGVPTLG